MNQESPALALNKSSFSLASLGCLSPAVSVLPSVLSLCPLQIELLSVLLLSALQELTVPHSQ